MNVIWSDRFNSDVKYYFKKKNYRKIFDDIESVIPELEKGNFIGNRLEGLKLPEGTATYN